MGPYYSFNMTHFKCNVSATNTDYGDAGQMNCQ